VRVAVARAVGERCGMHMCTCTRGTRQQ
jgi:hypothetical protein